MLLNEYNLNSKDAIRQRASTGWLLKWKIINNGKTTWLKSPGFMYNYMYESYAEVIASSVANDIGIKRHIQYNLCILIIDGVRVLGCESNSYNDNYNEYTFKKLAELGHISDITHSEYDGYKRLIKEVKQRFNLNITSYLEDTLILDSIILNIDRNPWNLSILYNTTKREAIECPIYDSGSSLGLDGLHNGKFEEKYMYDNWFRAQPFDLYFENQVKYIRKNRVYNKNLTKAFNTLKYFKENFCDENNFNVVNTLAESQIQFVFTLLKARQESILMKEIWKA